MEKIGSVTLMSLLWSIILWISICTNYVTMLSIVYYINIIIKYGHSTEISKEEYNEIMFSSKKYLNNYHFFIGRKTLSRNEF